MITITCPTISYYYCYCKRPIHPPNTPPTTNDHPGTYQGTLLYDYGAPALVLVGEGACL